MNTILLGGIPRSGTTLTCHLLNQVPDTLALVEPLDMQGYLACGDSAERENFIRDYAQEVRQKIASGEPVTASVLAEGETNTFPDNADQNGGRKAHIRRQQTTIDKALSGEFTLIIKHPNAFAALLPELLESFPVFMHIRNPLSVLASWHSLDHGLRVGRAPMAERFDHALADQLSAVEDDLDRQIVLVNWYFSRFDDYLERDRIIRYEDVVATGGGCLRLMHPGASLLNEPLSPRNRSELYSEAFLHKAAAGLIDQGGAWQNHYSEQDVEELLRD